MNARWSKNFTTERNRKMIKLLLEKIKKNHALAMILCCGIPIVGIMALSFLGILGSWGYYALLLICPVGRIQIQMKTWFRGRSSIKMMIPEINGFSWGLRVLVQEIPVKRE
jgi:hypothetical protein